MKSSQYYFSIFSKIIYPFQEYHSLDTNRFYLVLQALDSEDSDKKVAYGIIFFRQDQLHIDLFVFFSVFFSCFFLFLAACVVAWKAKQAADVRRARRRHVVEMLHMAKRPFASVTLNLSARPKPRIRSAHYDLRPVAVEPTGDSNQILFAGFGWLICVFFLEFQMTDWRPSRPFSLAYPGATVRR